MKKIISILLALALSASLCACGNTDTNDTEDTANTIETTESTSDTTSTTETTESEEEKALNATQVRYEKAKECLTEYLNDGYFRDDDWKYYEDATALKYLYKEFEACGDYEESEEILSRFTVLPDMLTSITNTKTDNLGNAEEYTYKSYEYNKKGILRDDSILEFLGLANWAYDFQYEYDKHDNLVAVKLVDYEGILAIVTPEYDESGKIVKATIQTNTDTYTSTWTYDEQDHLITAEKYVFTPIGGRYLSSYTYTYDANGHLTKEQYFYNDGYDNACTITYSYYENGDLKEKDVKDYKSVYNFTSVYTCAYEYTYDVNGYLVMKKENNTIVDRYYESQTSTQFLYTNDENGRPVSAELIETVDGKNSYDSQILTYNYETLYFYDAE